jgi:hypothetical protein
LIADGRPKEAIASLKSADATVPAIGHVLGVAYYHADDHQRAIELLSAVRDKLPEGSMERREAAQVLGLCYYLTGRFSDAIPLLEQTREWATGASVIGADVSCAIGLGGRTCHRGADDDQARDGTPGGSGVEACA